MKRQLLIAAAFFALPLAACDTLSNVAAGGAGLPSSPVEVCDASQLDENVGIAVETAYKAWRIALELGVDTGLVKGALAAKLAALDNTAYGLTVATQSAYKACNAAGYATAATQANAAITQAIAALRNR